MASPITKVTVQIQESGFISVTISRQFGDAQFTLTKRHAHDLQRGLEEAIRQWEDGDF